MRGNCFHFELACNLSETRFKSFSSFPVFPVKMVAVHFTKIPWKSKTVNRHIESYIFVVFVPVLTTLYMQGLKFLELICAFFL